MSASLPIVEAKAHFSEHLRRVEAGDSLLITRHGRPVAALVPPEDLEQLRLLRAAGPQAGLAGLAGGWEGSEELADLLEDSPRVASRAVTDLD